MITAAQLYPRIKCLERVINALMNEQREFTNLCLFGDAEELAKMIKQLVEFKSRTVEHRKALL